MKRNSNSNAKVKRSHVLTKRPSHINNSFKNQNTKKKGMNGAATSGLTTIFTKKYDTSKVTHSISEEDDETQF